LLPIREHRVHHAPWALVGRGDHWLNNQKKLDVGDVENHYCPYFKKRDFAALSVDTTLTMNSDCVPVYDLQIEEEHEFFANGVLVHNCEHQKERDLAQYLGQAYAFILVDEVGQFSADAMAKTFFS